MAYLYQFRSGSKLIRSRVNAALISPPDSLSGNSDPDVKQQTLLGFAKLQKLSLPQIMTIFSVIRLKSNGVQSFLVIYQI